MRSWDYTPISPSLFGDAGPWTWEVPTLWRALADPDGPWAPPPTPWSAAVPEDRRLEHDIAYWSPLMTLTYGVLGWPRPELGIHRWLTAGRPTDEPALAVLDRWWGDNALGLLAWDQQGAQVEGYSRTIAEHTDSQVGSSIQTELVRHDPNWRLIGEGASDPLHLGHVLDHLLGGPELGSSERPPGLLIYGAATDPSRDASLLLSSYSGWYRTLAVKGATLPTRPDSRSWRVHVTVQPLGYLGSYRRSTLTGRWFMGRHRSHMLGWAA